MSTWLAGVFWLCVAGAVDEIKDFEDLRGRKLAIVGMSLDEIALDRCLNAGGMTTADVQVMDPSLPDIVAAMANGSIDGGMVIEPFVAQGTVATSWISEDPSEYDPMPKQRFSSMERPSSTDLRWPIDS